MMIRDSGKLFLGHPV